MNARLFTAFDLHGQPESRLIVLVKHFEFQQGGILDQAFRPLGVLDPGKLDHQFRPPLTLQQRFRNAELIDPISNRLQGLIDGRVLDPIHFAVEDFDDQDTAFLRHLKIRREFVTNQFRGFFDRFLPRQFKPDLEAANPFNDVEGDILVGQQIPHGFDGTVNGNLDGPLLFHLQHQVNAALQVETERDAARGNQPPDALGNPVVQSRP